MLSASNRLNGLGWYSLSQTQSVQPPVRPHTVPQMAARSVSASRSTSGRRSGGQPAWKKAGNTDRWTEILFRALTARVAQRRRFVSFRGTGGGEWRGVVDVLATRKDTSRSAHRVLKSGDLFQMVLVQVKGGSARSPSAPDIQRLKAVRRRYRERR